MKLRTRLIILLLTLISVPTGIILTMTFSNLEGVLLQREVAHLDVLAESKEQQIVSFLQHHTEYLKELVFHYELRTVLLDYRSGVDAGLISDQLHSLLNRTEQTLDYDTYQGLRGKVAVYTMDGLLGSTFVPSPEENTYIEEILTKALPEEVRVFYHQGFRKIFFVYSLVNGEEKIGYVIEQVHVEELTRTVIDYYGLEDTGEVILAFRNDVDETIFVNQLRFEDSETQVISNQEKIIPVELAVRQIEDMQVAAVDYRGRDVISATRFIPELGWGLVVKKDRQEALSTFNELKRLLLFIAVAILGLSAVMAFVIATSISLPLITLTNVTREFGKKFTQSVVFPQRLLKDTSELGTLANAFQDMANSVFRSKTILESQVADRTQKLLQSQQLSQTIEAAMHIGSWKYDFKTGEMIWSEEMCRRHGLSTNWVTPSFEVLLRFVHPEDRSQDIAAFDAAIEKGLLYKQDKRIVWGSGEIVFVHAEAQVTFDEKKQPLSIVGWYIQK